MSLPMPERAALGCFEIWLVEFSSFQNQTY
jgi:hypothetical protein